MELRALGSTGIQVSPLGLGTVKLGRNQQVKYPRPFELPGDEEVLALLGLARELGVNLLDTAPAAVRNAWAGCSARAAGTGSSSPRWAKYSNREDRASISASITPLRPWSGVW